MDDYISRKVLIEHIKAHCGGCDNCGEVMHCAWDTPAADVEPVRHEMWEEYSTSRFHGFDKSGDPIYRDGAVYYCSNPRCRRKTIIKEKYCPNCGAKMDGRENYGN